MQIFLSLILSLPAQAQTIGEIQQIAADSLRRAPRESYAQLVRRRIRKKLHVGYDSGVTQAEFARAQKSILDALRNLNGNIRDFARIEALIVTTGESQRQGAILFLNKDGNPPHEILLEGRRPVGAVAPTPPPRKKPFPRLYSPSQIIAKLRLGHRPMQDAAIRDRIALTGRGRNGPMLYHLRAGEKPKAVVNRLKLTGRFEYVELDHQMTLANVPNDPYSKHNQQWALTSPYGVNAFGAWASWTQVLTSPSGWEIIVAVIDSGVDKDHEDLKGNLVPGWDFLGNDNDPEDESGHGTHIAGIIAAVGNNGIGIAGLGWRAPVKVMPLKAFDKSGLGYTSAAIKAFDFGLENGAVVFNTSWVDVFSQGLKEAVTDAHEANAIVAAAAGNEGEDADKKPQYPASFNVPNVLSVGALNHRGEIPSYSNTGRCRVDVLAPGSSVLSTFIFVPGMNPNHLYSGRTGTSMAAPQVAGIVAQLLARYPLSVEEVMYAVRSGVVKAASYQQKTLTGGRVDMDLALAVAADLNSGKITTQLIGPAKCPRNGHYKGGGGSGGGGGGCGTVTSESGGSGGSPLSFFLPILLALLAAGRLRPRNTHLRRLKFVLTSYLAGFAAPRHEAAKRRPYLRLSRYL